MARGLIGLGFKVIATKGTAAVISAAGLEVEPVNKVLEDRPHIVDRIKNEEVDLIINTTEGRQAISDSATIRSSAEQHGVYYTTTLAGGQAVVKALQHGGDIQVRRLQDL